MMALYYIHRERLCYKEVVRKRAPVPRDDAYDQVRLKQEETKHNNNLW